MRIQILILGFKGLRECMEISLENLYVDNCAHIKG